MPGAGRTCGEEHSTTNQYMASKKLDHGEKILIAAMQCHAAFIRFTQTQCNVVMRAAVNKYHIYEGT